jgi:uncharacterized membrane protein
MRILGLLAVIPSTVLLTLSFFVWYAAERATARIVEQFGLVVVFLLWLCAGIILLLGLVALVTGRHPIVSALRDAFRKD